MAFHLAINFLQADNLGRGGGYVSTDETKAKGTLCNCDQKECPTPYSNRYLHVNDECVHLDGTKHKLRRDN